MAQKKRKPAGDGPKRPRKRKATPPTPVEMEGLLRELVREFSDANAPESPLDRAYEILEQVDETTSPKQRERLAREALAIDPDCADAYLVLANAARSRNEAVELCEQAVAAAERALGPEIFREGAGDFWLMIETRPYMRARTELAHLLWNSGRRAEAADHLQDMLRLNPNDNQGHRYTLASWLASLERDELLGELLGRYDEPSAMWAYSKALHAFRTLGDTPASRKLLKEAKKRNKFAPNYLTGEAPLPRELPGLYGLGTQDEAILYAAEALSAWRDTPGAVTWVRETLKSPRKRAAKKKAEEERPGLPTNFELKRLERIPQKDDDWLAGFGTLSSWIEVEGEPMHPWVLLIASRTEEAILNVGIVSVEPTAGHLWELLAKAMDEPAEGKPRRPITIEIQPDDRWDALEPHLDTLGVELVRSESIETLDMLLANLGEYLAREQPPSMLDVPGVTPEHVADFFAAAADYYRDAPWKRSGLEQIIEVRCEAFESGPWYAIVMGESGVTLGLALYEDLKQLRKLLSGRLSDEEGARMTVALATTFEPAHDLHPGDLDAARAHGWEVAGPEAFPTIYRKERGMSMRPPLAWELGLMAACLRAIPQFLTARPPTAKKPRQFDVATATGTLTLSLRLIE